LAIFDFCTTRWPMAWFYLHTCALGYKYVVMMVMMIDDDGLNKTLSNYVSVHL